MSIDPDIVNQLKSLLGQGGFVEADAMQPYLNSWRNGWSGKSPLIAMPKSAEQTASLVKICAEHHIPIVPQGGNTGLVGGSIPSNDESQIVVNMSRMNKIRDIDQVGSTVTVEAGVILKNLQDTAADAGLLFPLSMASEGSCEIGGAISTNAGGTAVLRYGTMRDLVMGIEAVLPDGQIFHGLKTLAKDNAGYNLGRFFVGAEGTLSLVTAATLKLFPAIKQKVTSIIALPDAETALQLLQDFRRDAAEYLTAFEIMSHQALKLVTQHIAGTRFPGKDDAPYYLLVELGSTSAEVSLREGLEQLVSQAHEDSKVLDAVIAENDSQSQQFWSLREHISEAIRKTGPGIHFDISLPLHQLADFLIKMDAKVLELAPHILLAPFGHIGDGNLHYNMCFAKAPDDFADLKRSIQAMVYAEVNARHGSISAEHGIGVERKAELARIKAPHELLLMKKIKQAFDPNGLMNPGKVFD